MTFGCAASMLRRGRFQLKHALIDALRVEVETATCIPKTTGIYPSSNCSQVHADESSERQAEIHGVLLLIMM